MSKERLSKLQKWILEEIYINGHKVARLDKRQVIFRNQIYYKALEDGMFKTQNKKTNDVVLSRSIWTLIEHGYIEAEGPMPIEDMAMVYGMMNKTLECFQEDYKDLLKEKKTGIKVASQSVRNHVQAKLLFLTEKGRAKAKELFNVKE